ncbi:hypothetical protein [Nitratireductor indicus]|uniref:Uncharacterized protein n=1 Tax=Nitratireductor indicus C115 TaxID=1231190 RepID=K2NK56_9HYPH|nr:hypothetical protein [Nitratireductor indicus]EKF39830.1 hypothetical protein NA8A_23904 [Nitratireductor indicus C115]MDS1138724.1 hypothetical protein [Nitratireductor indicus]SFQ31708.1 hypothetical protein SAMN05216176_102518 [Nitratireductor indicus]
MRKLTIGLAVVMSTALTGSLQAADMTSGSYCPVAGGAKLLAIESNASLTTEVVRLMDEAVAVADSPQWINSGRPAFVWASEAKVACGKAYGYLRSEYRDEDYLNKCECFHARMVEYMY